jgi:putative membrane protein
MRAPSLPQLLVGHWAPAWPLDAILVAVALLYAWAVARLRDDWPLWRAGAFAAGLLSIAVALESGIGSFDDQILSVHMVQHMLLLMLAPLLLLIGDPVTLALRTLPPPRRPGAARALRQVRSVARPVLCLAVFDVILVGTHLRTFYDATLSHPLLHELEHTLYVVAGLAVWWPIVGPEPVRSRRLGGLGRLLYMLAAMPGMALIGAYLNRHATLVYAPYGPASRALGISPIADQAQAGAIMWVAGSAVMTVVGIWGALAGLVAEERQQRLADARANLGGSA